MLLQQLRYLSYDTLRDEAAFQTMINRLLKAPHRRVDVRRNDSEPRWQHQVERDALTSRRTYECVDPTCDIKLPNHRHYARKEE